VKNAVIFFLLAAAIAAAPRAPVRNYDKPFRMYWRLSREYPQFHKLPEMFFHMSTVYLSTGHLDSASIVREQIVQRFPQFPKLPE